MAMSRPLDTDVDPSEMLGSEVFYEFSCDMCSETGKHLEAEGYCKDCQDYLCSECIGIHRRTRLTMNHQITTKADMPKVKPREAPMIPVGNDLGTKPCSTHRRKFIEYYCGNHSFFGCHACITVDHRNCEDVHFLPDVAGGLTNSTDFKAFVDKVEAVEKESDNTIQTVNKKQAESDTNYTDVLNEIKQARKDINDALDKIENHFQNRADSLRALNDRKLKRAMEYCRKTSQHINRIKYEIKQLQQADKMCQLFVLMKESEEKLERLLNHLQKGNLKMRKFVFKPDTRLPVLLTEVTAFGSISLQGPEDQASKQNQGNVADLSVDDILAYIGVDQQQDVDQETKDFIYDFINKHGGMEAMKLEMDRYQPSREPPPPPSASGASRSKNWKSRVPPPPTRAGPPPPPPNRSGPPPPPPVNKNVTNPQAPPSTSRAPPPPGVSVMPPPPPLNRNNQPPPPPWKSRVPPPPTRAGPPPPPPNRSGPPPPPPVNKNVTNPQAPPSTSRAPPPPGVSVRPPPPPLNRNIQPPPPPQTGNNSQSPPPTGKVWPPPPPPSNKDMKSRQLPHPLLRK